MKKVTVNSCFDMTKHRSNINNLTKQDKEDFLNEYIGARYPRFKVSKAFITGQYSTKAFLLCKVDFNLEAKDE